MTSHSLQMMNTTPFSSGDQTLSPRTNGVGLQWKEPGAHQLHAPVREGGNFNQNSIPHQCHLACLLNADINVFRQRPTNTRQRSSVFVHQRPFANIRCRSLPLITTDTLSLAVRRWENSRHIPNWWERISELGGQRFGPFYSQTVLDDKKRRINIVLSFSHYSVTTARLKT
ncbi:hypothetical protein TNCV_4808491 [Trichonephila clavipes]|nr:hypothetical protein TNCV_4808491 [Trichonephila clavipes]